VLAQLGFLATLVIIWNGLLEAEITPRRVALLALAATFPGGVYLLGGFPTSLLTMLLATTVVLMARRRWVGGAIAAAVASTVYPLAVVLPLAIGLWRWFGGAQLATRRRVAVSAGAAAITATGTLVVFAVHALTLDDPLASLREQQRFDAGIYNPVLTLFHAVVGRNLWIQRDRPGTRLAVALTVAAAVAFVALVGWQAWSDKRIDVTERAGVAGLVGLLFVLPLATSVDTGLYRRLVPLVCGIGLLRNARPIAVYALLALTVAAWLALTPLYIDGTLI